jgi:hypothetical protein
MRVYDIWDYIEVAVSVVHLLMLIGIAGVMGLLVYKDFNKVR